MRSGLLKERKIFVINFYYFILFIQRYLPVSLSNPNSRKKKTVPALPFRLDCITLIYAPKNGQNSLYSSMHFAFN